MNRIQIENFIKNGILVALLFFTFQHLHFWFVISETVSSVAVGDLLFVVSIIAVTACFGNFAFTYERIDTKSFSSRCMAHLTTGLLMLIIGISLEMTVFLVRELVGTILIFDLTILLLYIACVFYDFWDLERVMLSS